MVKFRRGNRTNERPDTTAQLGTGTLLLDHMPANESESRAEVETSQRNPVIDYVEERQRHFIESGMLMNKPFATIRAQIGTTDLDDTSLEALMFVQQRINVRAHENGKIMSPEDSISATRDAIMDLTTIALSQAMLSRAREMVVSGEQLDPAQAKQLDVAVSAAVTRSADTIDKMAISAWECLLDGIENDDNVGGRAVITEIVAKHDRNPARASLKEAITALQAIEFGESPSILLINKLRQLQQVTNLKPYDVDLLRKFNGVIVSRYKTATDIIDSPAATRAEKDAAYYVAKKIIPLAEATGVKFENVISPVASSQTEVGGKRLDAIHTIPPQAKASKLPRIAGITLNENGFGATVIMRKLPAVAGISAVATAGVVSPAAAEGPSTPNVTAYVMPTNQPSEAIDSPELTVDQSAGEAEMSSVYVETPESTAITSTQNDEQPKQPVTPNATATPENPMQVELQSFQSEDIEDADIVEHIRETEQNAGGWDRETVVAAYIDRLTIPSRHNAVTDDDYIGDVEGVIAEFDSYLSSGSVTLSPEQLKVYRQLTTLAQIYATYPSYLAEFDTTNRLPDTEFVRTAIQMLRDTDLPLNDAGEYQVQQREAIEKILANAYALMLTDDDKKALITMYAQPDVPEESATNSGNTSVKNDHQPSHNTHEVKLSEDQIQFEVLKRMEAKGPEWQNRAKVMKYFMKRGYTATQAAGAIGNFWVEAAGPELLPSREQFGGGPGRGIVQWGSQTDRGLDRFGYDYIIDGVTYPGIEHIGTLRWFAHNYGGGADNWDNLNVQLGFIEWELNHTQKGAGANLKNADTLYEATDVILNQYERPAERKIGVRLGHARNTLNMYKKIEKQVRHETRQSQSQPQHEVVTSTLQLESHESIQTRLEQEARNNGFVSDDAPAGESGHLSKSELKKIGPDWGSTELQNDAATSFEQLGKAFEKKFGKKLDLTGGYRSFKVQQDVYNDKTKITPNGTHLGAVPGTSEHGWGMAVDISTNVVSDYNTTEYKWLTQNVEKYGWFKPDWAKEDGNKPEPWHWEYAGGMELKKVKHVNTPKHGKPDKEKQSLNAQMPISRQGFTTPVDPSLYNIGTGWNGYEHESGFHTGVDIEVSYVPVRAVKSGVVVSAGVLGSTGILNVTIETSEGLFVDYQHLDKINVEVGQRVEIGENIGVSGNSGGPQGYSTGPHLHVSVSTTKSVEGRFSQNVENLTKNPVNFLPSEKFVKHWANTHR